MRIRIRDFDFYPGFSLYGLLPLNAKVIKARGTLRAGLKKKAAPPNPSFKQEIIDDLVSRGYYPHERGVNHQVFADYSCRSKIKVRAQILKMNKKEY